MHGTFYVTQAVGKRWIAAKQPGNVMSIIVTWVRNGSPYVVPSAMSKSAIHAMTMSLAIEWGALRHPAQRHRARRDPDRRHEQAPQPRRGARRAHHAQKSDGPRRQNEELQNLAMFLMAGGCDWLNGESIVMDGAQALATGGNFYELRDWSDADWHRARDSIEAQNEKDRAQRG